MGSTPTARHRLAAWLALAGALLIVAPAAQP